MNAATPTRRLPPQSGLPSMSSTKPISPLSALRRNVSSALTASPDDGSPQAPDTANDEHRQRQEREVEVDVACWSVPARCTSLPRSPRALRQGERPRRSRWMSIPVARAAAGSSRAARSFRLETAALVEKGDRDDPDSSRGRLDEVGRLRDSRERQWSRGRSSSSC